MVLKSQNHQNPLYELPFGSEEAISAEIKKIPSCCLQRGGLNPLDSLLPNPNPYFLAFSFGFFY